MGFTTAELSDIDVGQALDYMAVYVENERKKYEDTPEETKTVSRKATQADFDMF